MNVQTAVRTNTPEIVMTDAPSNLPAVVEAGRAIARETQMPPPRGPYPAKIAKAIVKIMRDIGTIEKNGLFDANGTRYSYQKWDDLLASLSPLLAENGLIIMQSENSRTLFEGEALVLISYDFTIVSEDGEEWPLHPRWSSVSKVRAKTGYIDDKAVNKCHTAASKYFLINLFKIKSIEVDDSDASEDAPERPATLPKKDAKPIYTKLQGELDGIGSALELAEWGKLAAERIKILPADWADHMRMRFKERLIELRQREAGEMAAPAKPDYMPTHDSDTGAVLDDPPAEPPMHPDGRPEWPPNSGPHNAKPAPTSAKAQMAAMDAAKLDTTENGHGVPRFLERTKPPALQPVSAFDDYLRQLEGALCGCETADAIVLCGDKMPVPKGAPTAISRKAASLMNIAFDRVSEAEARV